MARTNTIKIKPLDGLYILQNVLPAQRFAFCRMMIWSINTIQISEFPIDEQLAIFFREFNSPEPDFTALGFQDIAGAVFEA